MKYILIFGTFLLTGCANTAWMARVSNLAEITPPTIQSVNDSYTTANIVYEKQQTSELVGTYAQTGYHPGVIKPFIGGDDLNQRQEIAAELREYAMSLGRLVTPKKFTRPEDTGDAVMAMNTQQQNLNAILLVIDQIATSTFKFQVSRKLPKIMQQADPYVQQFHDLFKKDLVDLTVQTDSSYSTLQIAQDQFIQTNQDHLSPIELRIEIEKLATIEKDQLQADEKLRHAGINIDKFAALHHALCINKKD